MRFDPKQSPLWPYSGMLTLSTTFLCSRHPPTLTDGNHYKGLMQASDYKAKREEVSIDPEVARQNKVAAAVEMVKAKREKERLEQEQDDRERQLREEAKRERLTRELQDDAPAVAEEQPNQKKKKKKTAGGPTLSFSEEDG